MFQMALVSSVHFRNFHNLSRLLSKVHPARSRPLKTTVMSGKQEKEWSIFSDEDNSLSNFGTYGILILNRPITISPEKMSSLWSNACWRITVDGGTNRWFDFVKQHSLALPLPNYVTGDFDSIRTETLEFCKNQEEVVVENTPDQDYTDFDKGLKILINKCPHKLDCFLTIAENSGRLDQIFSNLNTLYRSELHGYLLSKPSITWMLHPGSHRICIPSNLCNQTELCGVLPLSSPAKVTTKGLKWDLDNHTIEFGGLISSSNTYNGSPVVCLTTDTTIILSRIKPAFGANHQDSHGKAIPTLEQFLANRDYTGAITLLEFDQSTGKGTQLTEQWLGYCAFHLGDYKKAMDIYNRLVLESDRPEDASINLACCYFFLGLYEEAQKVLEQTPKSSLKRRLQFHLAHKLSHEAELMELHQQLENVTEDMLCLAALHYLRSSYHEAIDIYKKILLDNRIPYLTHESTDLEFVEALTQTTQFIALNVYVALCYYKLDYYDMSQEVLATYLQKFPDSATALNLKACNFFKLENVRAAENEIMSLLEKISPSFIFGQDIIKHNLVAFRDGTGALQVLPPLVDIISEARLNLTIFYLKQGDYMEAYELTKNLEPTVSHEYILKATVNAVIGQETNSRELIKAAQQYFQLVGNSVSECDTIPGRQCMASAFFFQRKFDDVHLYLSSIKSYFFKDDAFNFNYAQAKSALGNYKEAEETFLRVQNDKLQNDYVYITHMARCCIMQGKAQAAWELYLKMDTSTESLSLLQLIANDCYKKGEFYHAAKAFDLLERLDPTPEHWEGKRGACIGVFQLIVADRLPTNLLSEIIQLLRNSTNPQVESIIRVIKRWAKERKINV